MAKINSIFEKPKENTPKSCKTFTSKYGKLGGKGQLYRLSRGLPEGDNDHDGRIRP
jgi:hypothetical protein